MPELPDVEVFRNYLNATSLHREIETVHVRDERLLEGVSASTVRRRLKGSALEGTRRHGKLLFVSLSEGGWLVMHFGMTGELTYYEKGAEPEHTALLLDFVDGSHLAYRNRRTFGRLELAEDVDEYVEERGLGPDPLAGDFGLREFRSVLEGRSGAVKTTLMNQQVLAGLGNIYVDELLFDAGVHPETGVDRLSEDTVEALWRSLRRVVDAAIEARVDVEEMPRTFLIRRREEGAACPRCDGTVEKSEVGGRATYFCPSCQAEGG
jgi:formamidopyrimidine-DNA glycosylase